MEKLIEYLKRTGVLRSERIEEALRRVDRADFVLPSYEGWAYADTALPIPGGQTISQPTTVVMMLEALEVGVGHHVLEVGLGSGWQAALLAELAGVEGRVYSIEYFPEVFEFARENLSKYHFSQIDIRQGDASGGWPEGAPYDRIIGAAEAEELSQSWLDQLKPGGRLVTPVGYFVVAASKDRRGRVRQERLPGSFIFVPLQRG